MLVEQIWTDNDYRNFNYLVACPETGEALAIDPLEYGQVLRRAKERGWQVTQVLNTHHHHDHTGGNQGMVEATGAKILAHQGAKDQIPDMDIGLQAGDLVKVGRTVELEALDTPGHTMSHICLRSRTDTPAVFCGDTLFNAGAGHCRGGGHPDSLYATFADQLAQFSDDTLIYPGHDYKGHTCSTVAEEKQFNPRLKTANGENTFAEIMNGLNLDYPKKIDEAVPANLRGGQKE